VTPSQANWSRALATADALVLAPTAAAATGMSQPADGAESGRLIGHRVLDHLSAEHPDLHVVLVSHFLVGHGVTHRNAKPQTWGLRTLPARCVRTHTTDVDRELIPCRTVQFVTARWAPSTRKPPGRCAKS
jgi:hypothetical protein